MRVDVVGVIEAAYAIERDDTRWLSALAEHAAPALDKGFGVAAALYKVSDDGHAHIGSSVVVGGDAALFETLRLGTATVPPAFVERMFRVGPKCQSSSTLLGIPKEAFAGLPVAAATLVPKEIFDTHGVISGDPSGTGCTIMAPKRKWGPADRRTVHVWSRIAAHLAAAHRLRGRLASASEPVEAVLSPSGRIEHAEHGARDAASRAALVESAKRLDRARGSLRRRAPLEAVDLWRALVDGRWSLVDHFDNDGRRFLLARPNEPSARSALRALSARQRDALALATLGHGNKFIGYQLGLTSSAVAMLLARAAQKLGVRSRLQLMTAFRRVEQSLRGRART